MHSDQEETARVQHDCNHALLENFPLPLELVLVLPPEPQAMRSLLDDLPKGLGNVLTPEQDPLHVGEQQVELVEPVDDSHR